MTLAPLAALSFARLDRALVDRARDRRELAAVARRALVTIALGGGAYGAVFGAWRAPEAACASAIKLPLVFLGVVLVTTAANAILAPVLRSALSTTQAAVVALTSFATTATVLCAVGVPVLFVVLALPPVDPAAVGVEGSDPRAAPSIAIAQGLVLFHTAVIAGAGIAGVLRLLSLLERLGDTPAIARRIVVAWLGTQFLVGAELSWRLRPFLGGPTAPVRFLAPDAFEGSFFEEIARLGSARFGGAAPLVLALAVVVVALWLGRALRRPIEDLAIVLDVSGLSISAIGAPGRARFVPWRTIRGAHADGALVTVTLAADHALDEERLRAPCAGEREASELAARIETARRTPPEGPFRSTAP